MKIISLKVSSLRQDGWYSGITNFLEIYKLVILTHILNGYDISLNTTNYLIFNMQDFRNGVWFTMLDMFWSHGSPLWDAGIFDDSVWHPSFAT